MRHELPLLHTALASERQQLRATLHVAQTRALTQEERQTCYQRLSWHARQVQHWQIRIAELEAQL